MRDRGWVNNGVRVHRLEPPDTATQGEGGDQGAPIGGWGEEEEAQGFVVGACEEGDCGLLGDGGREWEGEDADVSLSGGEHGARGGGVD